MSISEDEINRWLFDLFLRRESLSDYESAFFALASMCRTRDEFDLVVHSAEKLVALSEQQFSRQVQALTKHIKEVVLQDSPLAIVATAWGEKPDSSQQLVQRLKVHFRSEPRVSFFNTVNAYEKRDNIERFPRFILVDEFSGTGKTLIGRVAHIVNSAKGRGLSVQPHVGLLFGMEKALENVREALIPVHFCTELKAGISGYFFGHDREKRIATMKRLEEDLFPEVSGRLLPSLGHGEAEALFFVKEQNAPNSNFPIFWWPLDVSGAERVTVMFRAEL